VHSLLTPPTGLFVGRARELAIMHARFAAASARHGSLLLISGEAGIGKTALVATLAPGVTEGDFRVFVGYCNDVVPPPPYGLWLNLFAGPGARSLPLPPPASFAHPDALTQIPDGTTLHVQLREWFATLMAAEPHTPLVLVLEDLHWADAPSLDLFRALARAVVSLPVLIIATYREDALDRTHPLYLLLPHIVRETDVARIALRPLLLTDVYDLVAARYALPQEGAMRLSRYLHTRAEGNAFFMMELLYALADDGALYSDAAGTWHIDDLSAIPVPSLLRQVIEERVIHLGPHAHALLESAAVIGGDIPLALWVRISGTDEGDVFALTERATAAHLLAAEPDGATVRFVHALMRDALYAGIPLTRRRFLHRAVADVLIARANADPGAIAVHLQAAGDRRALEWLLRAAARAESTGAPASAITYLDAALALLAPEATTAAQQAELHLRIAILGRFAPWTFAHLQAAVQLAEATGTTAIAAVAAFNLAISASIAGGKALVPLSPQQRALTTFDALSAEAASVLARAGIDATERTAMRQRYAQMLAVMGEFAEVFQLLEVSPDETYIHHRFVDACGYSALGITYILLGRVREARAALADSVAWFLAREQYGSLASFNEWELNQLTLVYETTDHDRQHQLADAAERYYAQDDAMPDSFAPRLARVHLLAHEGEWDEALALINDALAALGFNGWYGSNIYVLGELAYARGDQWGVEAVVREVFPAGPDTAPGGLYLQNALRIQRLAATLALDAGNTDNTRQWLEAHDRWLTWSGAVLGRADGCLAWARYRRATGDPACAITEAQCALDLADAPRQPLALLAAHRLCGELAIDARQFSDARTHLDTALALADACATPYERALTLIALATLYRTTGEREADVDAALAEAHTICTRLGARPTLNRIAALIGTPRSRSTTPDTTLDVGLTKREYEVLVLLAEGGTNTTIANALSLSLRTVERHIANLYAKTGVRTRAGVLIFAAHHSLGHTLIP